MIKKDEVSIFSNKIENIVKNKNCSYLEAIVLYCEETGFELEMVSKTISPTLKSKIKIESDKLNLLKKIKTKTKRLPI
jgi:hypothetical protein